MQVNPYIVPVLEHVTDLLNRPPTGPGDLEERWRAGGMPVHGAADDDDVVFLTGFLRDWNAVVDADVPERVDLLNAMLARYTAPPSIAPVADGGWHLHYRDPTTSFGAMVAGAATAAAAQYLCAHGMHRLGRCAAPGCERAFVDISRPGRQRYCSPRCANRDAVRRHRARAARVGG